MKNQLKTNSNAPRTSGKFVFLILLCFSIFSMSALAQTKEITGTIKDDQGELLPGASVLEKGTSNGAVSDFDGNYAITVSQGAILVFSYVGYVATEVAVGSQTTINVTLKGDNSLDEIVLVGYGTAKKSDLTGAISSVGAKDFENQPLTRAEDALQSRTAGVNVSKNSGAPGGDIKIRIRGSNSITGNNQPLVVIDGIIGGDLSSLNTNDIQSIDVLKDASATAIYGSRGSNGVILVATKRGKAGVPQIHVNYFLSSSVVPKKYDLLSPQQFVDFAGAGAEIINGGADYQDEYFRTAITNNVQVTASGREGRVNYYLSGNLVSQDGIIINTDYQRYSLRSNISVDLTDKLTVGLNVYGSKEDSHNLIAGGTRGAQDVRGGVQAVLGWNPAVNFINPDGSYNIESNLGSILRNPIAVQRERDGNDVVNSLNANLNLSYDFTDQLNFTILAGSSQKSLNSEVYNGIPDGSANFPPNASYGSRRGEDYQLSNILTWNNDFGTTNLKLTGIYELQSSTSKSAGFSASQYSLSGNPDAYSFYLAELAENQRINANKSTSAIDSYVARAEVNFNQNLFLTATMRVDESSRFREGNRTGYFPSVSAAYNLGNLFLTDDSFVNSLKLRAGYGETGNQNVAPYSTFQELNTGLNFPFDGSSLDVGVGFGGLVDENLTWETTKQINVGVDFNLVKNRLNLSIDWYKKNTVDLLLEKPVLASNGGGTILTNIGEVENTGVDVTFSAAVVDSENFSWDSNLTMSFVDNKIVDLGGPDQIVTPAPFNPAGGSSNWFLLKVGEPLGNFYGYQYLGADENGAAQYSEDQGIIGNGTPTFTWGLNNTLNYKKWDLNFLLRGVHGYEVLNSTLGIIRLATGNITVPTSAEVLDPNSPTSGNNFINSTRNIEDGSFIRLSNLSLGYTLPSIKGFSDSVKIYVSGQNLFTITDYKGYDPEVSSVGVTSSDVTASFDAGALPNPRTVTFGVNIGF
ncbi:SusC/RagA family TonB-linked outer membrane protein [Gelidibacter salicanalis]|uniref:TonB-dependent receptor n=1 Tax=Gelidibacter salicanalis TaxID=291193 RepID=A0A934L070_9FLAO|nr:TonB-dependent receptor [Gelidibacter salicanalis]MBJ7883000.1 TonB-dependent receptor [Gelidibacter salicanalis]